MNILANILLFGLLACGPIGIAFANSNPNWHYLKSTDPKTYDLMFSSQHCLNFIAYTLQSSDVVSRIRSDLSLTLDLKSITQAVGVLKSETLMVLQGDEVIYTFHDQAHTLDTPHRLWSASKFMTTLLAGTAVQEGRLDLNQKVSDFFPAKVYRRGARDNALYEQMRVRDLLLMQSGLSWGELETTDFSKLSVLQLLFTVGNKDMARFVLSQPMAAQPGTEFNYSTGDFTLLTAILKKIYGSEYDQMPWKNFFDVLDMSKVVFETDQVGTYAGGSGIYMSTNDMAKVGQLILADGVWRGKRILPQGWVHNIESLLPSQASLLHAKERLEKFGAMGEAVWINKEVRGVAKAFPSWPEDTFMSIGFLGQNLVIIPSLKMVIVRTGNDFSYGSKIDHLGKYLFQCLKEGNYPKAIQ